MSSGRPPQEAEALTVEWIEVSARTLDDARELALDRLGVVADELEYEVIDEPRGGLFGIGRTEARIRARVKPLSREKPPDRRRRRSSERRPSGGVASPVARLGAARGGEAPRPAARRRPTTPSAGREPAGSARSVVVVPHAARRGGGGGGGAGGRRGERGPRRRAEPEAQGNDDRPEAKMDVDTDAEDVDVEAQAERGRELHPEPGRGHGPHGHGELRGSTTTRCWSRSTVRVSGCSSGPRGSTLQAIEELVRAVVQHGLSGRSARLRVDVGGYRERRREALAAFARQVAEEVRETQPRAGARADEPARPQGRARHGRRDRRCGDQLRGRRAPAACGDPPGVTAARGAEAQLLEVLADAQSLGFLGPGDPRRPSRPRARASSTPSLASSRPAPDRFCRSRDRRRRPGLVLAAVWPDADGALIESSARRCAALEGWVGELGLEDRVEVLEGRAEDWAHDPGLPRDASIS